MTKAATHALAVLAPVVTLVLLVTYVRHHEFAVDFKGEYWVAAHRLLTGGSLYSWTHSQVAAGISFPYPALAAVLLTPFALIPKDPSAGLYVTLSIVALLATLRVLSVRDWRVYALSLLLFPVINAWQAGNMTLLIGLLAALVWRYRENPLIAGLLVALAISLKQFAWPIGLWLLATRRFRAAAWALAGGLAANLAAWGLLGYGQIHRYLDLSSRVTSALWRSGYSIMAMAGRAGASHAIALDLLLAGAVAVALACLWQGARRRRDDTAFALAVMLMLVASPLLWNHYFALLIVPLAILRPRLSAEWLAALVLWFCPSLHVTEWEALLAAGTTAGILYRLVRERPAVAGAALHQRRPGAPDVLTGT